MRRRLVLDGGRRYSIQRVVDDKLIAIAEEDAAIIKASPLGQELDALDRMHQEKEKKHRQEMAAIYKKRQALLSKIRRKFRMTEKPVPNKSGFCTQTKISQAAVTRMQRLTTLSNGLSQRIEFMDANDALAAFDAFKEDIKGM